MQQKNSKLLFTLVYIVALYLYLPHKKIS